MPILIRFLRLLAPFMMLSAVGAGAQTSFADEQAILQFQRAADSYAFAHRQTERRGAVPTTLVEGTLFTPAAANAFRSRIRSALASGCVLPDPGADFSVPRVNTATTGTAVVPPCIAAALPKLPAELEFRLSGVALVLADAHLHIVVDVLHAAFPRRDD